MQLQTQSARTRRERERAYRAAAKASRSVAIVPRGEAASTKNVWRSAQLPQPQTGKVGVPLSEGVTSVLLGALLFVPLALVAGYATWTYVLAAVLTVALSYALISRRVVVGPDFVAVRKFGPYRLASSEAITSGALVQSQRGGVLKLHTGDGRTMRLRRVEFSAPEINSTLRAFVLKTGRQYDEGVMQRLDLPWREDFGHHRYLLDAVQ